MKTFSLLTISGLLALCGCSHTEVGNGHGDPSPDRQHSLAINIRGAARRAYVDKTEKLVTVWILPQGNGKALFHGKYKFVAADLAWRTTWQNPDSVSVVFFDFGDKISKYDAKKIGAVSNYVATLKFHREPVTGQFSESR